MGTKDRVPGNRNFKQKLLSSSIVMALWGSLVISRREWDLHDSGPWGSEERPKAHCSLSLHADSEEEAPLKVEFAIE